ncbi:MAG: RsmB/NOP family class I SAM-dependent RNA methyltransferase, partial [Alphaproteobacteria bacterium]|nr:RsmB/NOP family class I SAM-dependent RNA methyltransferase [Alphaproteobacteria bacterium]
MIPSARVAAAIEILDEIARADAPADAILANWTRTHRFAGSKDRRAIRELVYRDLRKGAQYRWLSKLVGGDPASPRARMMVASEQEGAGTAVARFDGSQYGPSSLAEAELAQVAKLHEMDIGKAPDWVKCDCPDDIYGLLASQWPQSVVEEVQALNERAPVDLRVNTMRVNVDEARTALAEAEYECVPTSFSPIGLRGSAHTNFSTLTPFRKGLVDPQDESSQLVSLLVDAKPDMKVIDFCAGAGGKSLSLAAMMENKGEIVACDTLMSRLSRMEPRRARLGLDNIRVQQVEEGEVPEGLDGWADRVLVDAPCTGSGTWRRSPELRWRTGLDDIETYAATQTKLLATAAKMVRPGGRLIYAVCSIFNAEGRDIARAFGEANPEFSRAPVADALGAELAGRLNAYLELVLTPHRHRTDGMYAVI